MSVLIDKSGDVYYDGTHNVSRMEVFVDSASDLTGLVSVESIYFQLGSKATDVSTGDVYRCDSNGVWHLQPSESIQLDLTGYYTSAETDALLAGKQDSLTTAQIDAINNAAAVLPKLVDSGTKNIMQVTLSSGTHSASGIDYIVNSEQTEITATNTATATSYVILQTLHIKAGTYVVSGCPSGGGDATYKIRLGDADNANAYITQDIGDAQEFTLARDYNMYIMIYIFPAAGNVNLTFKPMICTVEDWSVSHEYVPYCPSLYDLYRMFLSI